MKKTFRISSLSLFLGLFLFVGLESWGTFNETSARATFSKWGVPEALMGEAIALLNRGGSNYLSVMRDLLGEGAAAYQRRINALTDELAPLRARINALPHVCTTGACAHNQAALQGRLDALTAQLATATAERDAAVREAVTARAQVGGLQAQLAEAQRTADEARRQLDHMRTQLQGQIDHLRANNETLQARLREHTAENTDLGAQIAANREEMARLQVQVRDVEALRAENARLKQQLRDLEGRLREKGNASPQEQARLARELATAQQNLAAQQAKIGHLEARMGHLQALHTTAIRQITGDRDEAREQVGVFQTQLGTAVGLNAELRAQIGNLNSQLAGLQAESISLNRVLAEREGENAGLRPLIEENKRLRKELETQRARWEKLLQDNQRLQARLLEAAFNTGNVTSQQEKELAALKRELDAEKQAIAALRTELGHIQEAHAEKVAQLEDDLKKSKEQNARLEADLARARGEGAQISEEKEVLNKALAELKKQADHLRQQLGDAKGGNSALEVIIEQHKKRISELEARQKDYDRLAQNNVSLQQELEVLRARISSKASLNAQDNARLSKLEKQIEDQARKIEGLEQKMSADAVRYENSIETLRRNLSASENERLQLASQIAAASVEKDRLEAAIKDVRQQVRRLESENGDLRQQSGKKDDEIKRLQGIEEKYTELEKSVQKMVVELKSFYESLARNGSLTERQKRALAEAHALANHNFSLAEDLKRENQKLKDAHAAEIRGRETLQNKLGAEVARLRAECEAHGQCTLRQQQKIEELQHQMRDQQGQSAVAIGAAEAGRQKAEEDMSRLRGLLDAAQQGEQGAKAELAHHKGEIETLKRDEAALRQQIDQLEKDKKKLQNELRLARANNQGVLEAQQKLYVVAREKDALQVEMTKLDGFLDEIARAVGAETSGNHETRKGAIIRKIEELRTNVQDFIDQSKAMQQQVRKSLDSGKAKDQDLVVLRLQVQQLQAHIEGLEAQLQRAVQGGTATQKEVAEARTLITRLHVQNEELVECLVRLAEAAGVAHGRMNFRDLTALIEAEIKKDRRTIVSNAAEIRGLEQQIGNLTTVNRDQAEKAGQRIQALEVQNGELQSRLEKLIRDAKGKLDYASKLQRDDAAMIAALKEDIATLEGQLRSAEAQKSRLLKLVGQVAAITGIKLPDAGGAIDDHFITRLIKGLEQKDDNFRHEADKAKALIDQLRETHRAQKSEIQELTAKIHFIAEENESIKRRSDKEIKSLNANLRYALERIESLNSEIQNNEELLSRQDSHNIEEKRKLVVNNEKLYRDLKEAKQKAEGDAQAIARLERDVEQNSQQRVVVIHGIVEQAREILERLRIEFRSLADAAPSIEGGKVRARLLVQEDLLVKAIDQLESARPEKAREKLLLGIPTYAESAAAKKLYHSPFRPERNETANRLLDSSHPHSGMESVVKGGSPSYQHYTDEHSGEEVFE